jgi:hypothetical protein
MKKLISLFVIITITKTIMADDLTSIVTNSTTGLNNGAIDLTLNAGVAPYTFQWTGPNGYSSSLEDISGLAPGTYCVTVSDLYCGLASLCVLVEEDIASAIEALPVASIQVFPNPFSKEFSIVINTPSSGEYYFQLQDENGRLIWAEKKWLASGDQSIQFTLGLDIASGKYELTVQHEKEVILSRSVISIR